MAAEAQTPAEYVALADYYEQLAQTARQEQQRYEKERVWETTHSQAGPTRHMGFMASRPASAGRVKKQVEEYEAFATFYRNKASASQKN